MTFKSRIFFPILLFSYSLYGQDDLQKAQSIDRHVFYFDSCEANKTNIGHFIVPKYSDSDSTELNNHYILDTVKRDVYKCIYDCTFRGKEEIIFYFKDRQLIKAIVKVNERYEKPFNATYYFDNNVILFNEDGKDFNKLWDLKSIKNQAIAYLNNMERLIRYLDKSAQ